LVFHQSEQPAKGKGRTVRFAIFSDIHGNIEAFKQVLADISHQDIQACYFLGDAISYGPEPDQCVKLLQETGISCILGNHELAIVRPGTANLFNKPTREHFELARKLLSPESINFISTWPKTLIEHDMLLVHGCPPASVTRYLFEVDDKDLSRILTSMGPSIAFVGHTHELEMVQCTRQGLIRKNISRGVYEVHGDKVLICAGSVGQPRDMDSRAKYVIRDQENHSIEVRYVEYDIEKTVKAILDRGFPSYYAQRLR
jgi:predicted phosphodiesterase